MKKEASQLKKEAFEDVFEETRCGRYQRFLWDLMEKPHTSLAAKVTLIYCSLLECFVNLTFDD